MSEVVLVVDDDPDIRETLREILSDEGYEVATVGHGQEALAYLARARAPCVILLDLMMPVMSGVDFRAAQRSDATLRDIPVVAISAARNLSQLASQLDGVDFLPKPIQLDDLLEVVQRHCAKR